MASRITQAMLALTLFVSACDRQPPTPRFKPAPPKTEQTPIESAPAAHEPPATAVVEKLDQRLVGFFRLIQSRQTGAARVQLLNHIKLNPNDGQAMFLFGLTYHREKKYAQAIPHFERALELTPNYQVTHYFIGWARYYLGELESSRTAFERYLAVKPDEPDANFGVGLIELDEHNLDEARRRFEKSIAVLTARNHGPQSPDAAALSKAHARLSEVFEERASQENERENLITAKSHLVRAIELFPDAYEAMYKLYRLHIRLGEDDKAAVVHRQYLAAKERVRPGTAFPE